MCGDGPGALPRGKNIFFLPGDEVALAFNLKTQSVGVRIEREQNARVRGNCRYSRKLRFSVVNLPCRYQPRNQKLTLGVHTSANGRAVPIKRIRVRR